MATPDAFERFVRDNCGDPNSGTASSYRKAIDRLTGVFLAAKPSWSPVADVWTMSNPKMIMDLYEHIKAEQDKFIRSQSGIFAPYKGRGDSYYRKRWCSAALKFFAQYCASESMVPKFNAALGSSKQGEIVAKTANRLIATADVSGFVPDGVDITTREGKEIVRNAKQRIGQDQFRRWILGIYGGKCCVTGLSVATLLRASHIVAWADDVKNRLNPENGLCLSATYDAAFDKHLITFDEHYKMVLSKSLKDYCTDQVHKEYFLAYEGKPINLPSKFRPNKKLLETHRDHLVA